MESVIKGIETMDLDTQTESQPSQSSLTAPEDALRLFQPLAMSVHLDFFSHADKVTVSFGKPSHVYALFAAVRGAPGAAETITEPPIELTNPANHKTILSRLKTVEQETAEFENDNALESFVKTIVSHFLQRQKWELTDETPFSLKPKYPSDPSDPPDPSEEYRDKAGFLDEEALLTGFREEVQESLSLDEVAEALSVFYTVWKQAVEGEETKDDGTYAVISFYPNDSEDSTRVGVHFKPLSLEEAEKMTGSGKTAGDVEMMEEFKIGVYEDRV